MIKKYNQFVTGKKVNESIEEFDDVPSHEMDSDDPLNKGIEEETEEEGGEYNGQRLMKELAGKLNTEVNTDGSVTYEDKKINFYSETEMFHVDKKKFKTVDEVVRYLNIEENVENSVISDERKSEGPWAQELESKSYKNSRKFESFRKKK